MRTRLKNYPYRMLITDILIVFITVLISIFVSKGMFTYHSPFSKATSIGIFLPLSFTIFVLLGFLFFAEYKFNKLSFKNVFLILGLAVAINNTIATLATPNEVFIEYASNPYIISGIDKFYSILYGFIIGFLPFILASLFPKKVNNTSYLKIILYVFVSIDVLFILISFFVDKDAYLNIINSKFTDFSKTVKSILVNKNIFGWFLFAGISVTIYLKILTKKYTWYIPMILFYIITIFTFSKSAIIVSTLLLLTFIIVNLIFIAKKSKSNLLLIILISSFIFFLIGIFVFFLVKSQTGPLFSIKKAINVALEQANATFTTRKLIWQCTINLLKPYQYIFGFGMAIVGKAIDIAYSSHPSCTEGPGGIMNAHNAWVELLAEGGIIYILIYITYLIILLFFSIKIYKKNKMFSIISIVNIILLNILGITGQTIIFGDTTNIFLTIFIIVPIASYYYINCKSEDKNRDEILDNSKSIISNRNFIFKFNEKRILLNSKHIRKDM